MGKSSLRILDRPNADIIRAIVVLYDLIIPYASPPLPMSRGGSRGKQSTLKRNVARSNSQSNGGGGSRKKRKSC